MPQLYRIDEESEGDMCEESPWDSKFEANWKDSQTTVRQPLWHRYPTIEGDRIRILYSCTEDPHQWCYEDEINPDNIFPSSEVGVSHFLFEGAMQRAENGPEDIQLSGATSAAESGRLDSDHASAASSIPA